MDPRPAPPSSPAVQEAVFTVNENWQITSFNEAAEKLMGLTTGETIGKSCQDVFSGTGRFEALCSLYGPLASGHAMHGLRVVMHKPDSQESVILLATAIPIPDKNGKLSGAIITLRDASDPGQIYPLVLDSIADGVFTVDKRFRITSFNKAAEQITGWTTQEVIGASCNTIFKSNICGADCILAQSVNEGKSIVNRSIYIKGKNGRTIPISISASPLVDPEGQVIGGVETFRDVTSSLQQDLILDSIADGVFTVDRNWNLTSFNKAAEQITGWHKDEILGKPCNTIFHSSICGDACILAQSVESGNQSVHAALVSWIFLRLFCQLPAH